MVKVYREPRRVLGLLATLVSLGACARAAHVGPARTLFAFEEKPYLAAYERWTRVDELFDTESMSNVLIISATLESRTFQRHYIDAYAHDYGLPAVERERLWSAAKASTQQQVRFLVTLAGRRFSEGNLNGDDAAWKVWLHGPHDTVLSPDSIERIVQPGPEIKKYFLDMSPFRHVFRITFPRPATWRSGSSKKLVLTVAGAYGTVELRWDVPLAQL